MGTFQLERLTSLNLSGTSPREPSTRPPGFTIPPQPTINDAIQLRGRGSKFRDATFEVQVKHKFLSARGEVNFFSNL